MSEHDLRRRRQAGGALGWTAGSVVRDYDIISKIRARQSVRNRLVLALTWTDERRRRARERQVLRQKVLTCSAPTRVTPVLRSTVGARAGKTYSLTF